MKMIGSQERSHTCPFCGHGIVMLYALHADGDHCIGESPHNWRGRCAHFTGYSDGAWNERCFIESGNRKTAAKVEVISTVMYKRSGRKRKKTITQLDCVLAASERLGLTIESDRAA